MKRLLLLTIDFPPATGGVARYLDALAYTMRDTIRVVAGSDTSAEARAHDAACGYAIERVHLFRSFWPRWWPMVSVLTDRRDTYDVVITSHVLPIGTAALKAFWFTQKPYVVIVHGLDLVLAKQNPIKRFIAGHVLRGAALVVTNSQALEREVRADFGVEKTTACYPVVRPKKDSSPMAQNDTRTIRLITVARLVSRKGHLRVIAAVKQLVAEGLDIQYTIVGDGPTREEIERAVRDAGLTDHVTFAGQVSDADLSDLYDRSALFVMPTINDPSDREGFGTVYIEAGSHGIPSIGTNLPGVDEAILEGKTGLLVADGDLNGLSDAIRRLATDSDLRKRLGTAAKDRALNEFTAEAQFGKLRELIERL